MDIEDYQNISTNNTLNKYVKLLNKYTISKNYNKTIKLLHKKFKVYPSKKDIIITYNELLSNNVITQNNKL